MENNKRSRELDSALFELNGAIAQKMGEDYINMSHTFDSMETEDVIRTMTENLRSAWWGYVMDEVIEENFSLEKNCLSAQKTIDDLKNKIKILSKKLEELEDLKTENKGLLWRIERLKEQINRQTKNSRNDIDPEDVRYLRQNGMTVSEIAKKYRTNRQTIYNKLKKREQFL